MALIALDFPQFEATGKQRSRRRRRAETAGLRGARRMNLAWLYTGLPSRVERGSAWCKMPRHAQAARTIAKLEPQMRAFLLLALPLYAFGAAALADGSAESRDSRQAAVCAACHGPDGNSVNPEWPSLARPACALRRQRRSPRSRQGRAPIRSWPVSRAGITPEDAADLGAYFSSLKITVGAADPALVHAGERIYRGGKPARRA